MSTLYLLNYNNYYNRIVKKEENLSAYLSKAPGYAQIEGVNFIPGDFVNTVQVVNIGDDTLPDYLLVVENNEIKSRWFVVEANRITYNQLRLTLHRDLVVDFYDKVINADCFIEKATIPSDNDLIFNKEDMTFNQIKQSETLLKDESKCPWICIYAASRTADGASTTYQVQTLKQNLALGETFNSQEAWESSYYYTKGIVGDGLRGTTSLASIETNASYFAGVGDNRFYTYYSYKNPESNSRGSGPNVSNLTMEFSDELSTLDYSGSWETLEYDLKNGKYITPDDTTEYDNANNLNNQIIRIGNDESGYKYFRLIVNQTFSASSYVPENLGGRLASDVYDVIMSQTSIGVADWDKNKNEFIGSPFKFNTRTSIIKLDYEDITSSLLAYNIDITDARQHLLDAPYDMFCLPYSDDIYINGIRAKRALSLSIAGELIAKYAGSGMIYDAQILPYCPLTTSTPPVEKEGIPSITLEKETDYTYIKEGDTNVGILAHATFSTFNREITLDNPIIISNYKIENECNMYRLCSPNYNGIFEFSAAKNGGVNNLYVQCTYKPFTPYIKIFPDWNRLYGDDFSKEDIDYDARGLICGGDFSLPIITSAWSTYEQQNKNYQLTFARQIENLEVNYKYQRQQEAIGAIAGTLSGGVGGAMAGAALGPAGIAIGGILGTAASGLGGVADLRINEALRNEALDYTKDQFGYQLGNIRALPQSLSKVSAYNIDNKYFPFLEYYTCSQVEKIALANKIKYNGMTVMVIGKIKDYIDYDWSYSYTDSNDISHTITDNRYIKGKLIRLENFEDDSHIANEIANEINKGVYFK